MAKYAVVMSSELQKFGRMDARFFIALRSVEKRYNELLAQYPGTEEDPDAGKKAVRAVLAKMTLKEKEACIVLSRHSGNHPKCCRHKEIAAIEEENPHLALAVIEPTIAAAIEALSKDVVERMTHLQEIKKLVEAKNVQA